MADALNGLFGKFIDYLFKSGAVTVPESFHGQASVIEDMLENDVTGIVNTVIDYSINSASEAQFKIECSDESLEELLEAWLEKINININGVPTGLKELSKEYYKERWAGTSLCLMRVSTWKKISVGNNFIMAPTVLWFVNGSSIYIKRPNTENYKLGTDKYFLDESNKTPVPANNKEDIIVQKPTGRWFTEYPIPYLIKKGVYKNWAALQILQDKSDEVISKILPYLLVMEKGSLEGYKAGVKYTDTELQTMVTNFKTAIERYNAEKGEIPVAGFPFDQKINHVIPELKNILSEELYRQGYRAMLSGLGFVSIVQGVGNTRKEEVINPKPFVAEVNDGVAGFKAMLLDVIKLIIDKNKIEHKKLFSDNNSIKITNTPIKLNIENLLDTLRSGYVYGVISVKTFQEILGIDPDQELERLKKEIQDDIRNIAYPHLIQNTERDPDANISPVTKKQIEKQNEKEKTAGKLDLEIAPYTKENHPAYLDKYPQDAVDLWITVFNKSLPKGEDYAFPSAWSVMKKFLKKNYDKNPDGTYTKKASQGENK